jgi:hypothetical protein
METIGPLDLIHVPSTLARCSACGSQLFASIPEFFVDNGEPVKSEIYVSCTACDDTIKSLIAEQVREWVFATFRVLR